MTAELDHHTLDLPPGFQVVPLREFKDAFVHAQAIAGERGAGTLVWAIVLEPELVLAQARCALYGGMNAAADALGQFCPPEKPIEFVWPDTILLDGGIIGGARLAWAPDTAEDQIPDWMVLGLVVRSTVQMSVLRTFDKGTSLETEGFEMMDGKQILESFTRHLMAAFDGWQAAGPKAMHERYLGRLRAAKGVRRGLDLNGDLLERKLPTLKDVVRQPLTAALVLPQWLDPATNEPWI
jgi:Biotin/lipoate A/B protein ligase family